MMVDGDLEALLDVLMDKRRLVFVEWANKGMAAV
jgi:hypothetical protein